jgi:hypothetical protein
MNYHLMVAKMIVSLRGSAGNPLFSVGQITGRAALNLAKDR